MIKYWNLFIIAFLYSLSGIGQGTVLEQYIQKGLQQNLGLTQQQIEIEQKELGVASAKGNFLPQLDFAATYLLATGGRDINFPVGDLLNPVYDALNQSIEGSSFPTNLENVNEQFLPNNFHDTRIRVTQPLFNTDIYYGAKIAEKEVAIEESLLKVQEANLRRDISVAYYLHLQTLSLLEVYDSTKILLEEILRFNKKLVQYDKATADVVSSVEFELADLAGNRADAVMQREQSKAYFNQLLHQPLNTAIQIDTQALAFSYRPIADLTELQLKAVQQRSELQQLQDVIAANDLVIDLNEKARLPQLGLELNTGFQGFGYEFNGDQAYATLGFSLDWNIYGGNRKKLNIEKAQLAQLKTQQQYSQVQEQIQLQVVQTYFDFQAAAEKLTASRAALKSAGDSFRIIRKRYDNQQVLLVELLDARTRLTNAQTEFTIAHYEVKIKEAELLRSIQ